MSSDRITILCVDDEDIPRLLRTLILKKQGYEVVAAGSGKEALVRLREGGISLVLTDQMMPGMTGTELTKSIKASMPEMPVIMISGVNEIPPDAILTDRFVSKVEVRRSYFEPSPRFYKIMNLSRRITADGRF